MARFFGLFVLVFALALTPAAAQQSGYSQWNNPDANSGGGGKLQDFLDRLNSLVDKAEKARAADPNFLRDLRDLAGSFDRPWRVRLFDDDFMDNNYTDNPTWTVVSGKFWVERGWGLRSSLGGGGAAESTSQGSGKLSGEEKAAQIFGQILGQVLNKNRPGSQTTEPAQGSGTARNAVIISRTAISNAFALETEVSSWTKKGPVHITMYQGEFRGPQTPGYRLTYTPGGRFELLRVSRRGARTVEAATGPYPLEDKKIHRIAWQRHMDGRMTVSVDDKAVLETSDRGFRDPFSGIALINTGGDYIVKRVTIMGAQ